MADVSNFSFLTDAQFELLLANGLQSRVQVGLDPLPVVMLFMPDAGATWLLSEIDPRSRHRVRVERCAACWACR